jgi:hypothetical protein
MPLSPEAELLLLIMVANGGEMSRDDAEREFARVIAMSPDERAEWRHRVLPLAKQHAEHHRAEET